MEIVYARTLKKCYDQDMRSLANQNKKYIPEGEIVVVTDSYRNFYGHYIDVHYDGYVFSLKPSDVEIIKSSELEKLL